MSVRLSARDTRWIDFREILHWGTFMKIFRETLNLIKIGHFTRRLKYVLLLTATFKLPYKHSLQVKWYQAAGMPEDHKH